MNIPDKITLEIGDNTKAILNRVLDYALIVAMMAVIIAGVVLK